MWGGSFWCMKVKHVNDTGLILMLSGLTHTLTVTMAALRELVHCKLALSRQPISTS